MDTDREQIVEALAHVAAALDSRDWDGVRQWFTPTPTPTVSAARMR